MEDVEDVIKEMNAFQEIFYPTCVECQRFCFIARAKEFQIQARENLEELIVKAKLLKEKAINSRYEDMSNALLSFEMMIMALINELSMWIELKNDEPGLAWDYLVEAQMSTISAMQAHEVAGHLSGYASHLYALEMHMFPNHCFFSIGAIIREVVCSICGQEYGECDHLVGKPYMGQLCHRVVKDYDLEEVSIVDKPANKHCRILSFTEDGVTRDTFTWKIIKRDGDKRETASHSENTFDD